MHYIIKADHQIEVVMVTLDVTPIEGATGIMVDQVVVVRDMKYVETMIPPLILVYRQLNGMQ
jgi:hypothetical protein